jgi:membrane protein YdbS with pleckstrin-like domain
MPTRYLVHGVDESKNERTSKVIEAETAKEAEATAARLGMRVLGSEVVTTGAATSPEVAAPSPGGRVASPAVAPVDDEAEAVLWSGSPSQWVNFWWFVSCILVITIPAAVYVWLKVRSTRYELTNQRLKLISGIIAKSIEDVELYRVNDSAVRQNVLERMLGLGDVRIETSDERNPTVMLAEVASPREVRETLRAAAERRRRWRRVGEVELMG